MLEKLDLAHSTARGPDGHLHRVGLNCIPPPTRGKTPAGGPGLRPVRHPALRNKFEDVVTWGRNPRN